MASNGGVARRESVRTAFGMLVVGPFAARAFAQHGARLTDRSNSDAWSRPTGSWRAGKWSTRSGMSASGIPRTRSAKSWPGRAVLSSSSTPT